MFHAGAWSRSCSHFVYTLQLFVSCLVYPHVEVVYFARWIVTTLGVQSGQQTQRTVVSEQDRRNSTRHRLPHVVHNGPVCRHQRVVVRYCSRIQLGFSLPTRYRDNAVPRHKIANSSVIDCFSQRTPMSLAELHINDLACSQAQRKARHR